METVLVTGGAGFIGSHLCDKLIGKYNVVCVDNLNDYYDVKLKLKNIEHNLSKENFHFICLDILDENFKDVFEKFKIDYVVHLAARAGVRPSLENPKLYEVVNIKGTLNVFELAKEFKVKKVIAASSSSVYGNQEKVPFSEDDNVDNPISPYAASKKSCELFGYYYSSFFDVIMLRFFTAYGERNRPDMAMYKWPDGISKGSKIKVFGDENVARDFTYVGDIVEGILKCFNVSGYHVINLGNSEPVKIRELLEKIESRLGKKADVEFMDLPKGDVQITYADGSKAKELLGWEPTTSIDEGLDKLLEWHKSLL